MDAATIKKLFPGYAGWNDEAAIVADFNATGGAGKGGSSATPSFDPNSIPVSQPDPTYAIQSVSVDDYINAIRDTLPEPPEEYLKKNPFFFDEQAATEVANAEFSPYYSEQLADYMGDINRSKAKSAGDTKAFLADLETQKEDFAKQNGGAFEKMIRGIKEGYATSGLYFSGNNKRDQNEATTENQNKLESYFHTHDTKENAAVSQNAFDQTNYDVLGQNKARDVGRELATSVAGNVQTQRNEKLNQYLYGMQTYYKNPNWKSIDPSTLKITSETGNTQQQQGTQY